MSCGELLGRVDLPLQPEVLVVGAKSGCSNLESVISLRVVVVGVGTTLDGHVGVVDQVGPIPAARILNGNIRRGQHYIIMQYYT